MEGNLRQSSRAEGGKTLETTNRDKQHDMDVLRTQALTCPGCPNRATRLRVVFGEGDVHAKVMLVGQGPGLSRSRPVGRLPGQLGDCSIRS